MRELRAIQADYDELWAQMPVAQERLKTIILSRLLDEAERANGADKVESKTNTDQSE